MRHLFTIFLACTLWVNALAQNKADYIYSVRKYGVEEGLLHRRVSMAVQDRQGYIWLATPAGVQRFDGFGFTNWTTAQGLTSNAISMIWPDPDGLLWLVSKNHYSEGKVESIDILDPRTGVVTPYAQHFGADAPCALSELVDKAIVLHDSTLLLSATGRLIHYRAAGKGHVVVPLDTAGVLRPIAVVRDGSVWCVQFRPRGSFLELVTVDPSGHVERVAGGPYRFGAVGSLEHCDLRAEGRGSYFIAEPLGGRIHEFLLRPDGTLEQQPGDLDAKEIFRWNGALYLDLGDGNWLVDATVRHVPEGVGPRSAPVLFDLEPANPEMTVGLLHVLRDRLGHVWICGEFGLWQLDMRPSHFQRWLQRTDPAQVTWRSFRAMVVQGDTLFAASEQDGWYAVDVRTGQSTRLDDGAWHLRYAMVPDGRGGLWAGRSDELIHWRKGLIKDKSIQLDRRPLSILPLADGRMLVGTILGLLWTDTTLTTFSAFDPEAQGPMANATVAYQCIDRSGTIWVCTSKGLGELDASGAVRAVWGRGDPSHFLPAEDIRHIHEDQEGIYWISTATNGLLRWDRAVGSIRAITQEEGLPSNSIYAVFPDAFGKLWMPTDNGIASYAPATGQIGTYTTKDGIAHNEFNRWSYAQGPDGRLYFGGLDGITAFHPKDLHHGPKAAEAPLVITALQQFDGAEGRLVDRTVAALQAGAITMRPSDRFFTLNMALLSYEGPGAVLFAWRVDGVDTDWNQQREPLLRFASLPYGTHALRIRAKGGNGEWTPELTLHVHVLRPWYWRWWAIALYVLAVAGAVYALFRYRLSRVRAMVAMRDRIALDLHDEVGSTLSSVALFTTVMGSSTRERPAEERAMLERIARNSAQAMEGMNDIVWSVNTRYERVSDVEDRMLAYAGPIAEAKDWDLAIEVEEAIRGIRLNMNERKNLYLIFKEAVNNAAKYAQCDRVEVRLQRRNGRVELSVTDNGVGFATEITSSIALGGNGVRSMTKRALDINGELTILPRPEGGTRITLRFVPHAE